MNNCHNHNEKRILSHNKNILLEKTLKSGEWFNPKIVTKNTNKRRCECDVQTTSNLPYNKIMQNITLNNEKIKAGIAKISRKRICEKDKLQINEWKEQLNGYNLLILQIYSQHSLPDVWSIIHDMKTTYLLNNAINLDTIKRIYTSQYLPNEKIYIFNKSIITIKTMNIHKMHQKTTICIIKRIRKALNQIGYIYQINDMKLIKNSIQKYFTTNSIQSYFTEKDRFNLEDIIESFSHTDINSVND